MPGVIDNFRISKPYKLANREFHDTDTIVHIGELKVPIGADHFTIFARPRARESKEQNVATVKAVKEAGGAGYDMVAYASHGRLPTASGVCSKTD